MDYHALNAMLNLYDANGKIQFDKDREAARQYFLQHVNQNTVFFHDFEERLRFLIENEYYEPEIISKYPEGFVKELTKHAAGGPLRDAIDPAGVAKPLRALGQLS